MHRHDAHPKLLLYAIHAKIVFTMGTPQLRVFASKHRKLDLREATLTRAHEVRVGAVGAEKINIKASGCGLIRTIGRDASMGEICPTITIPWLILDAVPVWAVGVVQTWSRGRRLVTTEDPRLHVVKL
jgi:hypothetical protein